MTQEFFDVWKLYVTTRTAESVIAEVKLVYASLEVERAAGAVFAHER